MDERSYFNDMLVRLEELLFHELSGCAAWKVELIGVDFIQSKNIEGNTVDEVIGSCIKEIIASGVAKDITYSIGPRGILLILKIKDCIHLPKEAKLREEGVTPYICPITNMILDQLIEKLNFEVTYIAELNIDEHKGECVIKSAIYEDADKIGQVSDWTKV